MDLFAKVLIQFLAARVVVVGVFWWRLSWANKDAACMVKMLLRDICDAGESDQRPTETRKTPPISNVSGT